MPKSRRKARVAALRTLYQFEIQRPQNEADVERAVRDVVDEMALPEDLAVYYSQVVRGVRANQVELDRELSTRIQGYEYDRLAAVDRNVLRVAAYEILYEPAIAPAITVDEAVEIAKKYSTAESGRFVNGVLGRLVRESAKANWDSSSAPQEAIEVPEPDDEDEVPVVEEEPIDPTSEEGKRVLRFGWKIRTGE